MFGGGDNYKLNIAKWTLPRLQSQFKVLHLPWNIFWLLWTSLNYSPFTLFQPLLFMLYNHPFDHVSFYLIMEGLKVLVLQQRFIQEVLIAGSTLPTADCISQDSRKNFSHPTCSSYTGIDILPMKRQDLCFPVLESEKGCDYSRNNAMWLLRPGHKRQQCFHPVLLGCSFLEP